MREVELDEIAEVFGGYAFKSKDFNETSGVPVIKISNIQDGEVSEKTLKEYLPENYLDDYENYQIRRGDILVALSGATTGKTGVYNLDSKSLLNQRVGLVRAKDGQAEQKYLSYYVSKITDDILNKAQGVAQPNISTKELAKFKIPLPTLSKQKAIVAKLDRAQRLIDIDKEMLAKYDELIQSVFLEMFGDPVRNPKGWEVKKLGDIVEKLIAGKSFKSTDDDSGNYRVIKTGAVSWNTFDKSESKALPPDYEPPNEHLINKGDILISRMNTSELVGASVLVRDEIENYTIPDRIWKVKWKSKDSQTLNYFWQCINHESFRNEISKIATGTSGSMKNMSKKKMFNMDVILPPIELQKKFDDICNKIQDQKTSLFKSRGQSEELFSSLVQGAFG